MTQQAKKEDFYMRDHIKAYMYMYSKTVDGKNQDFFKNINFRNYIKFEQ